MVEFNHDKLAQVCRNHGIMRLSVFGSAIRPDFTDSSDIDLLVEFQPGRTPGFALLAIEREMSTIFGRYLFRNNHPRPARHRSMS